MARRNGKVFITGNSGFPKSLNIQKSMEEKGVSKEVSDKFRGYGTALKPAHEPVAVFAKSEKGGVPEPLAEGLPFCYNAKAGRKERNLGCEGLFWLTTDEGTAKIAKDEYDRLTAENEAGKDTEGFEPHRLAQGNIHPTVKPIELCRYLVRLVKMPGDNLILDPFAGSGTTALACILEGCDFIVIEKDPVAFEIALARIGHFKDRQAGRR